MLGLYPIGSRAIASNPFNLNAVVVQMTATIGITFAVSVTAGSLAPISSTIGVNFSLSAALIGEKALSAALPISFNLTANVRDYGKPIILRAIPQSYTIRAKNETFALKAIPQNFTLRGSR